MKVFQMKKEEASREGYVSKKLLQKVKRLSGKNLKLDMNDSAPFELTNFGVTS